MKNTKHLFDESVPPEGMVSVSQLQTFMSCKKKWEYNYIEKIKPRVERSYLTIGKLCHKAMQVAMTTAWKDQRMHIVDDYLTTGRWLQWRDAGVDAMVAEWSEYIEETPLLPEEIPDINYLIEDARRVFEQAYEEFEPWRYDVLSVVKNGAEIPALELHFKVPCPPTKGLHGYIDAILRDRETGYTWCTDYKFRKTLAPDEDESYNIQNVVYMYACQRMGIRITGTKTWQHINTPAADPTILKDGSVSRAKIKTTWAHFAQFCTNIGQDPKNYTEMEEKLADIEWYRATDEYRNPGTVTTIWNECVVPAAREVRHAYTKKANNYRSLYPWNCKMCQYQSLCQAELRSYDANFLRTTEYTTRT